MTAEEREGSLLTASLLLGPATVVVVIGLVLPALILFRYSFNKFEPRLMMVEAMTPENYVKFFTDPFYTNIFWTTLRVALLCTLVCVILAFPLSYVLARSNSRYKNVLVMLVILPLFIGNAVRAAGWMTLFGSKGALNAGLLQLGVIEAPLEIMFTEKAVVIGIIAVNLPYMVLTLQSVLEGVPRDVEEAAFSLGAGPWVMFPPRAVAAGAPRHHRRRHLLFHTCHERLRDAHTAGRPTIQDDGTVGFWAVSPQQLAIRCCHCFCSDDSNFGVSSIGQSADP